MYFKIVLVLSTMAVLCCCLLPLPEPPVKDLPCACGKIYYPLCGSDGVTYDNICQFNCRADSLWNNEKIQLLIVKEDACDAPDEVNDFQ